MPVGYGEKDFFSHLQHDTLTFSLIRLTESNGGENAFGMWRFDLVSLPEHSIVFDLQIRMRFHCV